MKQQAIARLAWLVGMVVLASGSSSAQTPTTADEAAVRAVLSRMIDAFNAEISPASPPRILPAAP